MIVLIGYASRQGSTRGVAERIATRLGAHSIDAEVRSLDPAMDPSAYDAVVLGGPVYDGSWPPEATEFVYRHRDALATRPVWLFSLGSFGDHDPLVGRFMQNEPREIESLRRAIGPRDYRVFAGTIRRDQFPLVGRLVFRGFGGHWGDNRKWAEIDAWSDSIARALTTAPVSSSRSHVD